MAELAEDLGAKGGRRRASVEAATRVGGERRNRSLAIADDMWEKITVGALRAGLSRGAFVEKLLHDPLRRFVVQDRGGRTPKDVLANQADEARESGETIPISETVTSLEPDSSPDQVGAGEGGGEATPLPRRKRA